METLEVIPAITRLSKTVVRILGQNPGKFQLQGTNTYLVGERNPYVLIDTGEGKEEYIPFLKQALIESPSYNASEPYVSDVILTHRHHDHINGLPAVLALLRRLWDDAHISTAETPYRPPRIHKIPLKVPDAGLQSVLESLQQDTFTPTSDGSPLHDLADGDVLRITSADPTDQSSILRILHTPGHTPDSLCIHHPADAALFTADTVLGQGTAVFEDLGTYMASLRKMIDFSRDGEVYDKLYPGHGPVVSQGLAKVSMYLYHREEREAQIVNVLRLPHAEAAGGEGWTTEAIVANIYAKYPRELWGPAAHSVELHLKKLVGEGKVKKADNGAWVLLDAN
ncbi:Metallo-hydrolase/oxidoreductase [Trametes polyzona]|nr:Metallo-hydrolase/oxidoreductase [Trametes polyzona]